MEGHGTAGTSWKQREQYPPFPNIENHVTIACDQELLLLRQIVPTFAGFTSLPIKWTHQMSLASECFQAGSVKVGAKDFDITSSKWDTCTPKSLLLPQTSVMETHTKKRARVIKTRSTIP